MSLVNEMLRDLETRGASASSQPTSLKEQILPVSAPTKQKVVWPLWLLLVIGVLAAVVGLRWPTLSALWLEHYPSAIAQPTPPVTSNSAPVAEPEPNKPIAEIAEPSLIQLLNTEWRLEKERLTLKLQFDGQPSIELIAQTERSVELLLLGASATHPLALADDRIKRYQLSSELDRLRLRVESVKAASFSWHSNLEQQSFELSIRPIPQNKATIIEQREPPAAAEKILPSQPKEKTVKAEKGEQSSTPVVKKQPAADLKKQMATIQAEVKKGRYAEAMAKLERLLPRHPEAREMALLYGQLLLISQQPEKALSYIQEQLANYPDELEIRLLEARTLLQQGQSKEAFQRLSPYEKRLNRPESLGLLASASQQSGHLEKASALYQQLTKQEPNQARWWVGLGYTYEQQGARANSLRAYRYSERLASLQGELRTFVRQRIRVLNDQQ